MLLYKKPQALLFDLDGTLADTIGQLAKAAQKTAEALGIKVPSEETTKGYVGNGIQLLLCRIIAGSFEATADDVDPELLKKAREFFNDFYTQGLNKDFAVYPYAEETLRWCKEAGIKLAVVTNKPHMFAKPLLEYMGLSAYFDFILGGEILDKRKPEVEPLLYVLDKLKVKAQDAVMVGDSANDMLPALKLDMPSVFFTFGYCRGSIDFSKPAYKFSSWHDLLELLKTLP